MYIGKVLGNAIATSKVEELIGQKFLLVRPALDGDDHVPLQVAVDTVGAGIGEMVLVSTGSSARELKDTKNLPVDAVIVGIISDFELKDI